LHDLPKKAAIRLVPAFRDLNSLSANVVRHDADVACSSCSASVQAKSLKWPPCFRKKRKCATKWYTTLCK